MYNSPFKLGHPISWIPFPPSVIPRHAHQQLLNRSLLNYKILTFHYIASQNIIKSDQALFSLSTVPDISTRFLVRRFKRGEGGGREGEVFVEGELGCQAFRFHGGAAVPAARSAGSARPSRDRNAPGRAQPPSAACFPVYSFFSGCHCSSQLADKLRVRHGAVPLVSPRPIGLVHDFLLFLSEWIWLERGFLLWFVLVLNPSVLIQTLNKD